MSNVKRNGPYITPGGSGFPNHVIHAEGRQYEYGTLGPLPAIVLRSESGYEVAVTGLQYIEDLRDLCDAYLADWR